MEVDLKLPILVLGMDKAEVTTAKVLLNHKGYSVPTFDTYFNRSLEYALTKFQKDRNLIPTGMVDGATWIYLLR